MNVVPIPAVAAPKYRLASRMSRIKASAVREILKVTERPDVLSFAGGLPAPELFPAQPLSQALANVLARDAGAAMQYSTTEGWRPLREWLAKRLQARGIAATADRVLITSGSQQGIDLVAKVFLDRGDEVVVENPCYLAALQTFGGYEAKFIPVGSDEHGMRVDEVERALQNSNPKLIYVVSEFHNPKGTSLSLERRRQLSELSSRHGVPVVEDNPYGELRYVGSSSPLLASMDPEGLVIYLSTFSKTLSPGLRIGWAVAPEPVFKAMTTAKQSTDLHTSTLLQHAVARLLESFDYDGHLAKIRSVYGQRLGAMLRALSKYFPANVRWTSPEGGLFLWVELPPHVRAESLLKDAIRAKVAFVPGAPFFASKPKHNFLRLNFSNRSPELIETGIERLGALLHSCC